MRFLIGPGLAAALLALASPAGSATLTVNGLGDDTVPGDGLVTLREAILAAESDAATDLGDTGAGADTIVFAPALTAGGDATITVTALGDTEVGPSAFRIASDVTISGPTGDDGVALVRDAAVAKLRFFHVTPSGSLALERLTLANGHAQGGRGGNMSFSAAQGAAGGGGGAGLGGAVYARGQLAIDSCTFSGNTAVGGQGGAGSGGLSLTAAAGGGGLGGDGGNADPTGAGTTGAGGGGTFGAGADGPGGGGGGSLGDASGTTGGAGGGGNQGAPGSAGGGGGGGLPDTAGPAGGFGGGGGGGGYTLTTNPDHGGGPGGFGGGGGGGALFFMESVFGGGKAGFGGGAGGGFYGRAGYGGEAPDGGTARGGHGAGFGGAVFVHGASVAIENATFSGNSASTRGGAVFNLNGTVTAHHSTFTANGAFDGTDIAQVSHPAVPGIGGGAAHLTLDGVVLASGGPSNVYSERYDDLEHGFPPLPTIDATAPSLIRTAIDTFFGTTLNTPGLVVADPQILPIADQGGPTQTAAPVYPGSPAVDADPDGPAADQRGHARPEGPHFDLGAFEVPQFCGNGVVEGAEQCDDGNTLPLDGCLDCVIRCAIAPAPGCIDAEAASLTIDERKAGREKVALALKRLGDVVTLEELGDPVGGDTHYSLCVYAPALVFDLRVPDGGTCGARPCWTRTGITGYAYQDAAAANEGATALKVKGGTPGKGALTFAAANDAKRNETALATGAAAALSGATSATVQVLASDAGCFEAALGTVKKADGTLFKAK